MHTTHFGITIISSILPTSFGPDRQSGEYHRILTTNLTYGRGYSFPDILRVKISRHLTMAEKKVVTGRVHFDWTGLPS